LPVRQTLPPAGIAARGKKSRQKPGKIALPIWHGACDGLAGTKAFGPTP